MIAIESFLVYFSLEEGSFFIAWLVLISSLMIFYVNIIFIAGVFSLTPEIISDYLKGTELQNFSKEGNKTVVYYIFRYLRCLKLDLVIAFFSPTAFIVFLFATLLIWSISAVSAFLLIRAVERVSERE